MKMPLPFVYKKLPLEIQLMIKKVGFYPKGYSASYHELRALKESMVQVRAATKIPNIPLIVLSSKNTVSRSEVPAGIPVDKINKAHIELQRELAALSSKSEHIITKKSGHYIQLDQPELTVEAIRKIVDQVRG
jgi:pimeloyl-ACP methyl ester carboxylesterase